MLSGATDSTLLVTNTGPANAGSYACLVTNLGLDPLNAATLVVTTTADPGHIINISCRAYSQPGANQLIAGYVIGGQGTSGSLPVLIRASGPALTPFGVTGVLPDPALTLNSGTTVLATDKGWAGNAQVAAAAAAAGAFTWSSAASLDSALVESLSEGAYTAEVSGASGDAGVALAEVYDMTPAGACTTASPRLINISARVQVGTGGNILIAGFVIQRVDLEDGPHPRLGPALTGFGVGGVLPTPGSSLTGAMPTDPRRSWDPTRGWSASTQIATTASSVGAFSWGSAAT